jgi:glyoxalase family protein
MNDPILGLHHITAIASDAQRNVEFYVGTLGMRMVKRSVNQDDPTTYHLFYADGDGSPGTDLTFFPWQHMAQGRDGIGITQEVMLAVPAGTLDDWAARLDRLQVDHHGIVERFGERTLRLDDPDGMDLAVVETDDAPPGAPWDASPVPAEMQIQALHGVRLPLRDMAATAEFLTDTLGFEPSTEEEDGWHRYRLPGDGTSGRFMDLREEPDGRRGEWGAGSVHHVAWGVRDEDHELAVRARVQRAGRRPTEVIDRFWFQSVYFMEPGGALFELATLGPGFAVDEDPEHLGERLILPPWLEPQRSRIEAGLPDLATPPSPER